MQEDMTSMTKKERREMRKEQQRTHDVQQNKKKSFRNMIIAVVVLVVVVSVGVGIWQSGKRGGEEQPIALTEHFKGGENAKAVLVEYSDFQCPACAQYYPLVKQLHEELGDDVKIVYRHFPLRQIHPHAQLAGQAAEAAGNQGKFWEMHDALFEGQASWSSVNDPTQTFKDYAFRIGLDVDSFSADLNSNEVRERVDNAYKQGVRDGVRGTPSFYLNGSKLEASSYDALKGVIEAAIQ